VYWLFKKKRNSVLKRAGNLLLFIVIYCNPVLQRWLADVWKCTVDL